MEERYEVLKEMIQNVLEKDQMSLVSVLGGGAIEMFDRCLNEEVIPNILDINTDDKAREITLKVIVVPADDGRSMVAFAMSCKSTKLSGHEAVKGLAEIKIDSRGRTFAQERQKKQQDLPLGNVREIKGGS